MATLLTDLETEIMKCWMVTEDIDTYYKHVMDHVDYGKVDSDEVANLMLGLKTLYDIKFTHLFAVYEAIVAEQATQ